MRLTCCRDTTIYINLVKCKLAIAMVWLPAHAPYRGNLHVLVSMANIIGGLWDPEFYAVE